jgi:hypothetical protein
MSSPFENFETAYNVTTTLINVTSSGMKLLNLTGSGSANLTISVAGDMNRDGSVDGADAALLSTAIAANDPVADINGDGLINATDRQILYANYGFAAALAPQAIPQSAPLITTHENLSGSASLASVAQDFAGNPIFWTILGATNGTAAISVDGKSLNFTPATGYSGAATVTLQADDGFAASRPITVNVNVSAAKLININVTRLSTMNIGSAQRLQVTGDFADQTGVALNGSYLQIQSGNSGVISVDVNGILHAKGVGVATITVTADGIFAENAITSGVFQTAPDLDRFDNELNVYPISIDLPEGVGQRQIDVHTLDGSALGIDISTSAAGTQYFISDSSVAGISPDGLITAKSGGSATITVINGGLQGTIHLQVRAANEGPSVATVANGVVTLDVNGNTLMIGADALTKNTVASINTLDLNALDIPLPAPDLLNALGAVNVDLGGATTRLPLQLALKVKGAIDPLTGQSAPLTAGTEVMFWQEGTINDANGVSHQTWWLMDNGVIGTDGLAHTASQPYVGITSGGNILVTGAPRTDKQTGAVKISSSLMNFNAIWSQLAFAAIMPTSTMALGALSIFNTMNNVVGITYTTQGSYQLQIPGDALLPNSTVRIPLPPNLPVVTPAISSVQYDPNIRKLTISGVNFIPTGQSPNLFTLKVWLVPTGDQLPKTTTTGTAPVNGLIWQSFDVMPGADGTLQITLPAGVALSQHDIYIERSSNGSLPPGQPINQNVSNQFGKLTESALRDLFNNTPPVDASVYSKLVGLTPDTPSHDTLVTTANTIDIFQPATIFQPGANPQPVLIGQVAKDNLGNALNLTGSFTRQIVFNDDGTLAYIAGKNDKIYVLDTMTQDIVATYTVQGASAPINSLAFNNGWLYVAQGNNYGTGGQLVRVNVDSSSGFLKMQQTLILPHGILAPYGFRDMAVNNGRYLAIVASTGSIPITNFSAPVPGNVYVIDLSGVTTQNNIASSAFATLTLSDYPRFNLGKGPLYITSGDKAGQFLVSNAKDFNQGVAGVTFATVSGNGNLTGSSVLYDPTLTPAANNPNWLQAKFQQNIQRASGTVIINYQGNTYALVADYNFLFNDPNYADFANYGLGKQIGGKIGVIQDPFGTNGAPVYLGATTPIPGVALNQLSLDQNGMLYATAFVEDTSGQYTGGNASDMMYNSMFVWNSTQVIQAALDARQAGRNLTIPIDRTSVFDPQLPAVIPARYDTAGNGKLFGWIYGVGSSSKNVPMLTLQDVPYLQALAPGVFTSAKAAAVQANVPVPPDTKNGTLDTAMILAGAELTQVSSFLSASVQSLFGRDNSATVARMNEAQQVMNTVAFNTSLDPNWNGPIGLMVAAGSQVVAIGAKITNSLFAGVAQIGMNTAGYYLRGIAGIENAISPGIIEPLPAPTPFLQTVDNGATPGQLINYVTGAFIQSTASGALALLKMPVDLLMGNFNALKDDSTDALTMLLGFKTGEIIAKLSDFKLIIKQMTLDAELLAQGVISKSPLEFLKNGPDGLQLNIIKDKVMALVQSNKFTTH